MMESSEAEFGPVWTLRLPGGQTWVCVSEPELVDQVLRADPTLMHGGEGNKPAIPLQGETSILVLDEDRHTYKRNLMRPLFSPERVDRYEEWMAANCEEEIASWPADTPFQLLPAFERITLKNIIDVIFGARGSQRELFNRVSELTVWGNNMLNLIKHRLSWDYRHRSPKSFQRVMAPVNEQIFRAIREARQDPNLEGREDVLAVLVRADSDQEVRDSLMTLFLQGHQTSATAIAWMLERLMRHPDVMEKLRADLSSGSEAYLEAVVTETLRVRPPLPQVMRKVHREPFQLGELRLEPETKVSPLFYLAMRRPDVYPEPDRFRPERFLQDPPDPKEWMPFAAGDRSCIGRTLATNEMKAILRTVVERTRLKPAEPADEEIKWRRVLFSPAKGAQAVLTERTAA